MNGRLRTRVNKLRGDRCASDECDGGTTALLEQTADGIRYASGRPWDENAAQRCRKCGGLHPLIIREVIVTTATPRTA